ncbi:MAG: PIN domain-containing protein [Kiritimatiellia bacterium]|jgi:predicted nucleic acid-binding protein
MEICYTIQAEVVDITKDIPNERDAFLADTNVWYWLTYQKASQRAHPPAYYQTTKYPRYTNSALRAGARVFHSGLSLAELTHLIEKSEYEIFAKANPRIFPNPNQFAKRFRHNRPDENRQAVTEIESAWAQVTNLSEPLAVTIGSPTTTAALKRLRTEKVDGYDLFILETMRKHGVVQIITEDGDFTTVPGIQVFTANRNVLEAARAQKRLITRAQGKKR